MGTQRVRSRWRRMVPGLRGRTALALVAAVAIACATLTVATTTWATAQHQENLESRLTDSVHRDVDRLFAALKANPDARTLHELANDVWHDEAWDDSRSVGEALLIPLEGRRKEADPRKAIQWGFIDTDEPLAERCPECLRPEEWLPGNLGIGGSSMIWSERHGSYLVGYGEAQTGVEERLEDRWLIIRALSLPDQADTDPVPGLRSTLLAWSAGIVAASALVALAVAGGVITPMTRAGEMAEAVAAGDLSVRIPVRGTDDVATMSGAINTMADSLTRKIAELERNNEAQRRFVSDVAHELRTPTTALLASAQALRDPSTRDDAAELVAPQLARLAALTEGLLELSRMDAGRTELVASRFDLVDLIEEVVADARTDIAYAGPSEFWLSTDPVRLQAILRNLVSNAIQHGMPPVSVSVVDDDASVTIDVRDEGPGVPPGLRDHVFDRFVRGDESRHGTSSGLGLAIAEENARLLGGTLTMEDDGTTFRLALPTYDDPQEDEG